jgi:hypothetical protein
LFRAFATAHEAGHRPKAPGKLSDMTNANPASPKFADMTPREKTVFVCKIALCIISFGFIYPNVMND